MNLFFTIKKSVKRHAPWLVPAYSYMCWNFVIRPRWRKMGMAVFTEHYRKNGWGCGESVSGEGSTVEQTACVRQVLPKIVKDFEIRSMLDIPCGDFNWMRILDLPVKYIGADIVERIVTTNQQRYSTPLRSFLRLDLTCDKLPLVDLILCRDCLFHFSFAHASKALVNIKRCGARFLLTTTNTRLQQNRDIVTGEWRRLNLQLPPFSLPRPLMLIDEKCPNPASQDKHLGLWRIGNC